MLFPYFEKRKRNQEFIIFERRKRNFPFMTSNIPPKPHYITVFHLTLNPENAYFSLKLKQFSQDEKEKQRTESHKSRVERDFYLHNLENREEKEN